MEILKGIPVSPGLFIGEAFVLEGEEARIPERFVLSELVDGEVARFEKALASVREEMAALADRVRNEIGEGAAGILVFAISILDDPKLSGEIISHIRQDRNSAEFATSRVLRGRARILKSIPHTLLSQRASDIMDIERRLLRALLGAKRETLSHLDRPVAVVAHDLGPAQTASMDHGKVRAFALDVGGKTSHTAILARAYRIPAVVGLGTISTDVCGGDTIIVDGTRGIVVVRPDEKALARYRKLEAERTDFVRLLGRERNMPAVTRDGVHVRVMANIEFPEEVPAAIEYGAEGIGLFRTEFLYLRSGILPSEWDHFEAYRRSLAKLGGRPLVIRTFDLGADKLLPAHDRHERNPSLGLRSIRLSMKYPEPFRTQLRAIARASAIGRVRVMLPMVSTIDELRWARSVMSEIMADLEREGLPFDRNLEMGTMIEVPASAVHIESLAKLSDFFSIGTNDLIQYTLAVDRTDEALAGLYTPAHPSVLKLIRMAIDGARRKGKPIAMCGEMAGDILFTVPLIGMGLTEFSVAPAVIDEIKRIVRSVRASDCREVAEAAAAMDEPSEVIGFLRSALRRLVPDGERLGERG
ncbi:MAG: phosphoenolpyruvate--protein phosphotransferase [Planctomycetota bacterium]|nr:phosphoenolpyruvate--protein phosphotransferase [Planctomycetota bacterium]